MLHVPAALVVALRVDWLVPPDRKLVERQIANITASPGFRSGRQLSALLEYLVDAELSGDGERVKGYAIGVNALGRDPSFDPSTDAIVRVQVGRLRSALDYYYATTGVNNPIRIDIPKGANRVTFAAVDAADTKPGGAAAGNDGSPQPAERVFTSDGITVAVKPFLSLSGDPKDTGFADALSDSLTSALARTKSLMLTPRASTFQFRDPADLRHVAERLGVRYVVDGSVRQLGNQLRTNVLLYDAVSGRNLWAHHYDRTVDDVFAVHDDLVTHMASELRLRLFVAASKAIRTQSEDASNAWDLFIQSSWTPEERVNSLESELAHVRQARRALELDPSSGKAHSSLAEKIAYLTCVDPTSDTSEMHAEAQHHARRAIELEPADADVIFNVSIHHWREGRLQAATAATRRGLELEPTHLVMRIMAITIPYTAKPCPPELIEELRAIEADIAPDNAARWVPEAWISRLQFNNANYEATVESGWRTQAIYKSPETLYRLCAALAQLGDVEAAAMLIDEARDLWPTYDLYHYANVVTPRRHGTGRTAQRLTRLYRELADAYEAHSTLASSVV